MSRIISRHHQVDPALWDDGDFDKEAYIEHVKRLSIECAGLRAVSEPDVQVNREAVDVTGEGRMWVISITAEVENA